MLAGDHPSPRVDAGAGKRKRLWVYTRNSDFRSLGSPVGTEEAQEIISSEFASPLFRVRRLTGNRDPDNGR